VVDAAEALFATENVKKNMFVAPTAPATPATPATPSATAQLAAFAADLRFDAIPIPVVRKT
jgi:hypothetical protein